MGRTTRVINGCRMIYSLGDKGYIDPEDHGGFSLRPVVWRFHKRRYRHKKYRVKRHWL